MAQNATSNRADVPGADAQAQNAETYEDLYDGFVDGATSGEHRRLRIVDGNFDDGWVASDAVVEVRR